MPAVLTRLAARLRTLVHRRRLDDDTRRELEAHLEALTDRYVLDGLPPEAAASAARRQLGNLTLLREDIHRSNGLPWLDDLAQDVRYALRGLRQRAPGSTIILIASLAIGIGANTTIATIANALLLRAAAGVTDPDRLMDIARDSGPGPGNPLVSYSVYQEIRRRATTLDGVFAVQGNPEMMVLRDPENGITEPIAALVSTTNYFQVLGVGAAAGRLLVPDDEERRVIVLSHDFWSRRLHGDPRAVGRAIQLDGQSFTIVGVTADRFHGTSVIAPDAWLPLGAIPGSSAMLSMRPEWGLVGARLKPGASLAAAAAELGAMSHTGDAAFDSSAAFVVAPASPIPVTLRVVVAGFLSLLFGTTMLVLGVACANVAGVLLAQASARRREIAVRLAIGAGRARLVRQLLTETLILFTLGASVGLLVARLATTALFLLLPAFAVPVHLSLSLDRNVLLFTAALSSAAAMVFGLAPALHASRTDVAGMLKGESQGPADRHQLRSLFVVAQIALGLVLVICAGLLVRALGRTTSQPSGYSTAGIETAVVDMKRTGYSDEKGAALARELLARVLALPDVMTASLASSVPGELRSLPYGLTVPGLVPPSGADSFAAALNIVTPGYFWTFDIPFVAGRDFTATDSSNSAGVAIVSRDTAARLWPGKPAVGQRLQLHPLPGAEAGAKGSDELTVIGVVGDVDRVGPGWQPPRLVERGGPTARGRTQLVVPLVAYLPLEQRYTPALTIVTRLIGRRSVDRPIRSAVAQLDPNLAIVSSRALDDPSGPVETQLRVAAMISTSLGMIAVVLAALGIYGVTAFGVSQRTREIGVRVALGARRIDILWAVIGRGFVLIAAGCGVGLLLSAAATRLLRSLLFGLSPLDPLTFAAGLLVFVVATLGACWIPAWGAVRLNPVDALRDG